MDFFDDETSRAPADAAGPPSSPSRRRPNDRRRSRIQRLAFLIIVAFLVVFGLAWWARSCQHNRKVSTYETYFQGVSGAIADSTSLGRQVSSIMHDPTRLSRNELIDKLGQLAAQQDEIAVRAGRLDPPATLEQQQSQFAAGMRVRAAGFHLLRTAMMSALNNKKVTAETIAQLDGYFSGPDAYYQELVLLPARQAMEQDGVTGVAVPTSDYFLTWKALDPLRVQQALDSVGKSAKLTGLHGVALISVTAQTTGGDIKLAQGKTNNVPASADLAFVCEVQNQGTVAEHNVPVTAVLTVPGGDPLKQTGTIAVIEPTKMQTVTTSNFNIPETALSKEVSLKVTAGPVKGEHDPTNNTLTFKLLLQLQ
ncbi:MAG TPA: hypothetical protein VMH50_15970 [Thermoleophilia bacterium]|nr:hypothetical protein [Thermoleophilia bacterium]